MYCVRDDSGEEVSKSNCDYNEKPSHKQKCNPQPCPARSVNDKYMGGEGGEHKFLCMKNTQRKGKERMISVNRASFPE